MERFVNIKIEEFNSPDELTDKDRELLNLAVKATASSYSPYSAFKVGAAVRLTNGALLSGSNQENAAYPSGLCAERVVLFYAQSQYPDVAAEAIAVYAISDDFKLDKPVTPCGSCRQVMAEHESRHSKKIRVIMGGANGKIQVTEGIESLLPLMFVMEKLKKRRS
jgi:cytidine deaminase